MNHREYLVKQACAQMDKEAMLPMALMSGMRSMLGAAGKGLSSLAPAGLRSTLNAPISQLMGGASQVAKAVNPMEQMAAQSAARAASRSSLAQQQLSRAVTSLRQPPPGM